MLPDVRYVYDDAGRLAELWSGQVLRERYVYDDNGNRLTTKLYDAEAVTDIGPGGRALDGVSPPGREQGRREQGPDEPRESARAQVRSR